ncbi:hypothetical protein EYZ11_010471 [Aspergillus tanneri]|uniref:Uncharacterized protein n=1 Tax=Aspergillus tanneri TaxID=1220188 RepID=A0A4S3J5L3_9EURO|nr:hypothetical protein EYZ11_010471 [Aspergillus tanneri]
MALANVVREAQQPVNEIYSRESEIRLHQRLSALQDTVHRKLVDQGILSEDISYELYLNMRYQGTETSIMVRKPQDGDFKQEFKMMHLREFSFLFPNQRPIIVDDVRVRGIGTNGHLRLNRPRLGEELKSTNFTPVSKETVERKVWADVIRNDFITNLN